MFRKKPSHHSVVYYIQGIPGSGKTTLARFIRNKCRDLKIACALIDDEVWMHLSLENRKDFVAMLKGDYDLILITSVTPPNLEAYQVDRYVMIAESEKKAKRRHYEVERFGNDAKNDPQWAEYERWWKPWLIKGMVKARNFKPSYLLEESTISGRYKELYDACLAIDFAEVG